MAGKTADEVRVAVDGIVSVALSTATAPTTATSTLPSPWVDLGYVSEDGVTETTEISSDKIRAWQNAKVVRTSITEAAVTWTMTLIQTNADTVGLYYNGVVDADGSIVIDPTKDRPTIQANIDVIDGDEIIRSYAPEATISEVGDQVYQNGVPIGYEVTVEAAYNEALGGSVKKWYSALAE